MTTSTMTKEKLLITGAAGKIGQLFVHHLKDGYGLVLTDIVEAPETFGFPFTKADISSLESIRPLFDGVDTVIHLAADYRTSAPWESLLPNNVIGAYNVFEAAHQAKCKRVIFASSINSVAGYPAGVQVHTTMPVAPLNLYGASKAWGEAVGRFYADFKGLSVHCLRLGWVTPHDNDYIKQKAGTNMLSMTMTHRDLLNLLECCLNSSEQFAMVHGISDNTFKRLDISTTKELLGYAPVDDAFVLAGLIQPAQKTKRD
jgi:nucleoside-diphosphate-sugar epimerase